MKRFKGIFKLDEIRDYMHLFFLIMGGLTLINEQIYHLFSK